MKGLLVFCLVAVIALVSAAAAGEDLGKPADDSRRLEDLYFTGKSVELSPKERNALDIAKAWQRGEIMASSPTIEQDGSIEYLFGAEQPSIVCAVMQITDIELEKGESVTSVNLGDTVRWQVQPAISAGNVTHLLVRPREVGLETSLVVTTDKRTYHARLRSHRSEYMPRVKFFYMESALAKWNLIQAKEEEEREVATIPETGELIGDLDFGYVLKGKAPWKPVRVYNNGVKTTIEMPSTFSQSNAPILTVERLAGKLWKKKETIQVNYRVQDGRYKVDAVFDRAVLKLGVGGNQQRITIIRKPDNRGK